METIKKRWWAFGIMFAVLAGNLAFGNYLSAGYILVITGYMFLLMDQGDLNGKLARELSELAEKNQALDGENRALIGENEFVKKMLSRRDSGKIVLLGDRRSCEKFLWEVLEPGRFISVSSDGDVEKMKGTEIMLIIRLYGAKEIEERHPWMMPFIENRRAR